MKQPIHRCTADSKRGRQLMAEQSKAIEGAGPTQEQAEHNARIEGKRAARLARRQQRRAGK